MLGRYKIKAFIFRLRGQFRSNFNQFRSEVQEQNNQLRNEVYQGFANMQNYILLGKVDKKLNKAPEEKPKE